MTKDIFTFLTGLVVGAILGLLVRDKDKKRVKDAVNDIRKKYEELSQEGKELVKEGLEKAKIKL